MDNIDIGSKYHEYPCILLNNNNHFMFSNYICMHQGTHSLNTNNPIVSDIERHNII